MNKQELTEQIKRIKEVIPKGKIICWHNNEGELSFTSLDIDPEQSIYTINPFKTKITNLYRTNLIYKVENKEDDLGFSLEIFLYQIDETIGVKHESNINFFTRNSQPLKEYFIDDNLNITQLEGTIIYDNKYKIHLQKDNTYEILEYIGNEEIVKIPSSVNDKDVTVISSNAFFNNENIKEVIIPNTITKIKDNAFYWCNNIEKINFPKKHIELGETIISSNEKIKELYIPNELENIKGMCFFNLKALEKVKLDDNCTLSIIGSAFSNCNNLLELGKYTKSDPLFNAYLKALSISTYSWAFSIENGEIKLNEQELNEYIEESYRTKPNSTLELITSLKMINLWTNSELETKINDYNLKRESFKNKIKDFIEKNGKPSVAYYYDSCELTFSYPDKITGKEVLSSTHFNYWEDEYALIGHNYLESNYTAVLEELGLRIPVNTINYYEEEFFDDEY